MNPIAYLKIGQKILLLIFLVSALSTCAYTLRSYRTERQLIRDGIDRTLLVAAYSVDQVAGKRWHERARDAHSIAPDEYLGCVRQLTEAANRYHVQYVYAMVEAGPQIVFTCSSATEEELRVGTYDHYFQPYPSASDALKKTFTEGTVHFEDYTDKYGEFRSVFVPLIAPGGRRYVLAADISTHFIQQRLQAMLLFSLGIGSTIFVVIFLFGWLLVSMISRPIHQLSEFTRQLVHHGFQAPPDVDRGLKLIAATCRDEVGNLAESFIFMEHELQEHIATIKETTAARERIESELRVGREIQMSVLPQDFPPFPRRQEFDLHGHIEPAKEMSGDFFDYYMIDEHHLYLTVGDVSGKGVPASLLMVTCRTLLETMANEGITDPGEILSRVNTEIARKNEALLFVTVFYAVLDVRTGELKYANAGHNPPYMLHGEGRVEELRENPSLALGLKDPYHYRTGTLIMQPGDCFFVYTDGVTEAQDTQLDIFTAARMEQVLAKGVQAPMKELVVQVVAAVKEFVGDAPQSDDITIVAVRYRGPALVDRPVAAAATG